MGWDGHVRDGRDAMERRVGVSKVGIDLLSKEAG